jgi:hypothetical protein
MVEDQGDHGAGFPESVGVDYRSLDKSNSPAGAITEKPILKKAKIY